jgi:hypothetical protein
MSSFINKFANTVTKTTSSLVGRDNATKLTNSLNKTLFSSKYRDFMKAGNTLQIISKTSRMSLHICVSQNDPNRLILLGNGQIGMEALNSHFVIEQDPRNGHLKFKNGNNYICFDNDVPCIFADVVGPQAPSNSSGSRKAKPPKESLRARNEFRLVELIGSDENFCLESVYYPGKYLAVLQDGSITSTRNRADEKSHFCINVIHVLPTLPAQRVPVQQPIVYVAPVVPVSDGVAPIYPSSSTRNSVMSNVNNDSSSSSQNGSSKADEAQFYSSNSNSNNNYNNSGAEQAVSSPPAYSNLYPSLPN